MNAPADSAAAVAGALRSDPPEMDDLARARLERSLLDVSRYDSWEPPPPPRTGPRAAMIAGITVALAVTALVVVFTHTEDEAPPSPRTPAEGDGSGGPDLEASLVAEGMPAQGETLHTGSGQGMTAHIGKSRVRLEPNTRAEFERIAPEELRVRLRQGAVREAFHPQSGSGQRMVVATPAARVEVVGTVFRVEIDGEGATGVSVEQGTVKVVPAAEGEKARLVHAGQTTRIEPSTQVAVQVVGTDADADETPQSAQPEAPPEARSHRQRHVRGRVRLPGDDQVPSIARARVMLHRNHYEEARRVLQAVIDGPHQDHSTRTRAWTMIGKSYEAQGSYSEAAEAYGKAAWFGANTPVGLHALYLLGSVREEHLGDAHGARNAYERYLRQAPSGPEAPQTRAALCRLGACN